MKTLVSRKLSFVFLIIQLLVSAALVGLSIYVGFVPVKYIVALTVVCVVLLAYQVCSQMTHSSYIIGRVLCIFFCACLCRRRLLRCTTLTQPWKISAVPRQR